MSDYSMVENLEQVIVGRLLKEKNILQRKSQDLFGSVKFRYFRQKISILTARES
jgi:hypothetical protein